MFRVNKLDLLKNVGQNTVKIFINDYNLYYKLFVTAIQQTKWLNVLDSKYKLDRVGPIYNRPSTN